ncbi:hypothetical protein HG536_0G03740 [Torulaspora globosa]|uniref:Uncharacterized protein n=1 Tax=Torulaspora globosa TaxID=48254 RepID=A0A7G3ZLX6_9SACH|nr:uncharacterized protein HG536_0G03740 [Torulaspora globosa]QLL34512.1 hypothetical protein HG536_0G03740 [Torulaspora globosa]
MDNLKALDQVLRVEKSSVPPRRTGILYSTKLEGSIRFLGCQRLHDERHYVVCTSEGLHLFDRTVLKASYGSFGRCFSYLYVETETKDLAPLHAMFMSDGHVQLFEIDHHSIELHTSFSISHQPVDYGRAFISAASSGAIYVSFDSQTIFQCNKVGNLREIYKVGMGELMSFFFMRNGAFLFCLYRHKSTGHFYIEIAKFTTDKCFGDDEEDDSFYLPSGTYITSNRHRLKAADQTNCYFKNLNDVCAICITSQHTYILEPESPLVTVKNLRGLNLRDAIGVNGSAYLIESRNQYVVRASVFDGSGNVMESAIELRPKVPQRATWTQTPLLAGQTFEQDELSFVDQLFTQNFSSYLLVSSLTGVSIVDRMKHSISIILPGQSKKVSDGNCIPKDGSDLDSHIFCGAYTKSHGFIEKRTLVYETDIIQPIAKKQLLHHPVVNLWDIDRGLLYESMGYLYSTITDKRIIYFENSLWLTRNNVKIDVLQEGTVSVSEIDVAAEGTTCCVSVISVDGILKVLDYRDSEQSEILLSLDLGVTNIQNGKSAVLYSADDNCYYAICYHAHGCLKFFRDAVRIRIQSMGMDYFLSDLLLKSANGGLYVVLTSIDGRAKVLEWESGKCVLDISASSGSSVKILDLGRRSPCVLFYNENDCILANLDGMVYGRLDIGTRPVKIITASSESEGMVYLLDDNGCLNTLRFLSCYDYRSRMLSTVWKSDLYDLPDCVPMRLLPFSDPALAVLILKFKETGRLSASLFDYDKMCLVDSQDLGTSDSHLSNVLLRSLDDDSIPSESLRIFMKRFLIICCATDRESNIHVLHLNGYKLERLHSEQLPFPVLSICLIKAGTKILLGGSQTVSYEIKYEPKEHVITLNRMATNLVGKSAEHLRPPLFYSCRNNSCMAISLLGHYCEFDFSSSEMGGSQVCSHRRLARFGSYPLVQVVTKRLPNRRDVGLQSEASTKGSSFKTSADILRTLSASLTTGPEEFYMLTIDCGGYVNLYNGAADAPIGHFRLTSPMLSASPIATQHVGLQLGRLPGRRKDTRSLFMITCTDGLAYIVSEAYGFAKSDLGDARLLAIGSTTSG